MSAKKEPCLILSNLITNSLSQKFITVILSSSKIEEPYVIRIYRDMVVERQIIENTQKFYTYLFWTFSQDFVDAHLKMYANILQ